MLRFFIFGLFAFSMNFQAEAKVLLACEGKSKILKPDETTHIQVSEETGSLSLKINGRDDNLSRTTIATRKIDLAKQLKCEKKKANEQDACWKKAGDDETVLFGKMVAFAKATDPEGDAAKMDLSKITHGKSYTFPEKNGHISKFGDLGVFEYYDKSDKLVGRYLYMLEMMKCDDKEKPTKDESSLEKMLTNPTPKDPTTR